MRFFKTLFKMLSILLSIIFIPLVCLFIFLWIKSPGKPEPYLYSNGQPLEGAISEKSFVTIGGVKQGMFIKGKSINNPVLLYVHGGPAFPNYFLIDKYQPGLEDYFTVCYWEQRGGGLSFNSEVTIESMNLDQFSSDAVELTDYLKNRFGKEKIYIMAHSGGSLIALLAVSKSPEKFHAYMAMAQITKQADSEKMAYKYMLNKLEENGNKKAVNELLGYKVLDANSNIINFYKSTTRDRYMHELGIGTMHEMKSIFKNIFLPVWTCEAYTLKEKINIWKSKFQFLPKTNLANEILETDFTNKVPKLEVPIYFLSGKYDLTVNVELTKEYFNKIEAPLKRFYLFEHSAHSPIFEEVEKFREIIAKDILNFGDANELIPLKESTI